MTEETIQPIYPDKITIVEHGYHHSADSNPTPFNVNYSRQLETKDQVYSRKDQKVGEEWKKIDTGWLKNNVGLFVLKNESGRFPFRKPTEEQIKEEAKKDLLVSCLKANDLTPDWVIYPGTDMRVFPIDISMVRIRSAYGTCSYSYILIPR